MANPRKFSEKIALHNQKQAEETAAFEKIMREVSDATSQPDETTLAQFGLMTNETTNSNGPNNQHNPTYRESRGRSVGGGPIRRMGDRKIDTSPYSSGNVAYLSPPSDSSWRRTHSDSAIHQNLVQTQNDHHNQHSSHSPLVTLSPTAQRRVPEMNAMPLGKTLSSNQINQHAVNTQDGRPRSSCGLSRLPGINIYPSAHDNTMQIPIGNNTGSLPDLTSVHFPSPLHTPIDQEPDHSSSPYSSSPISASPATLSPTAMPARPTNARFQYISPANSPGDGNAFSPTHSQQGTSQIISLENSYHQSGAQPVHHQSYNNMTNMGNQQQQQQQQQQQHQTPTKYLQSRHSPPNNAHHGSHGNIANEATIAQQNFLTNISGGYRSPQCRPSPGSSPGLMGSSVVTGGDSNASAPCSPSPNIGNNGQSYDQFQSTDFCLNQNIQQHFEAFSLVDNSVSDYISTNTQNFNQYDNTNYQLNSNMDTMSQNQSQLNDMQQNHTDMSQLGLSNSNLNLSNQNLINLALQNPNNSNNSNVGGHENSMNNHQQQQQQQQQHQHSHPGNSQTPNTPTSIPEIILQDFSNDLAKDFYPDSLRPLELELGQMDYDGFQMLSNPTTMVADPTIEDSFRRDIN